MNTIVIQLSPDQSDIGTLRFEDPAGRTLAGPWPVAIGTQPEGDLGSRQYLVSDVIPMAGGDLSDLRHFGRYGIILLKPVPSSGTGVVEERHLFSSLDADLSATVPGTFRLRPENHRLLVKLLQQTDGPIQCVIQPAEASAVSGEPAALAGLPLTIPANGFPDTRVSVARLAAAAAALGTIPFFMPREAKAQGICSYEGGGSYSMVDFNQLAAREGGTRMEAYVPGDTAGVTIGAGLDLGRTTLTRLNDMGVPAATVDQLRPYLAPAADRPLLGEQARRLLASRPLTLQPGDVQTLNRHFFSWHANEAGSRFNLAASKSGVMPGITFSKLPMAFQTAMVDLSCRSIPLLGHLAAR